MTYIGSTTIPLSRRLTQHRIIHQKYKSLNNPVKKCTSTYVLEFPKYTISLLEDCPCERKEQLIMRERHYIENMECVNERIPTRTPAEYRENNREEIAEYQVQYRQANKEDIKARVRQFRGENIKKLKEREAEYTIKRREYLKKWQKYYIYAIVGLILDNQKKTFIFAVKSICLLSLFLISI